MRKNKLNQYETYDIFMLCHFFKYKMTYITYKTNQLI